MIALPSFWPWALVAIVSAAAGATVGYSWEHRARVAEVAQIRAEVARREAAAAEESRRRIEAASRAADAVIAQRDARIAELDAATRRLRHDLATVTTGRACLSAAARRVLHDAPAFAGPDVPAPASSTAGATAASAADSGDSTDADVAGWIIDAASLYEACRARIDALRQWDAQVNPGR
jgi:hypothetical protein